MNTLGNIPIASYVSPGKYLAPSSENNAGVTRISGDYLPGMSDSIASSQGGGQVAADQKALAELRKSTVNSSSFEMEDNLTHPNTAASAIAVTMPGPIGNAVAGTAIQGCQQAVDLKGTPAPGEVQVENEIKPEEEFSFSPWPQSTATNCAAPLTFGIVAVNDEHDNTFRKFPRETTIVRQREKHYGNDQSLIINLGDPTYNGNSKEEGPQFFGPVTEIFDSMNVEYFVPGNHDLDHGGKYLEKKVLSNIKANTLAGNLHMATGKPLEGTEPYRIEEIGGMKVGLIGLTTPKIRDRGKGAADGVTVDPIQDAVQKFVPEVREKGADVVVLLMHEGVNTARSIAASVPGIDVIIAAHDHRKCAETVKNPDGRNTVIVEAGGNSNYVGDLAITVDTSSKKVLSVEYKLFSTSGVAPDKDVADIIEKYRQGNKGR